MEILSRVDLGELLESCGLLEYPAVEVGVAQGDFAEQILQWGVIKLYLVDLWTHVEGQMAELGSMSDSEHTTWFWTCMDRLKGYNTQVLRGWSHEMANRIPDNSLGFVYLDATHTCDAVTRDLAAYYPKLIRGGVMAGHDYGSGSWPGVKPAVDSFAAAHEHMVCLIPENNADDSSFYFLKA